MIVQPSSSRVKSVMDLYCCWLLSCQLMPRIAIFCLCLPFLTLACACLCLPKAMQSTATVVQNVDRNGICTRLQRLWYEYIFVHVPESCLKLGWTTSCQQIYLRLRCCLCVKSFLTFCAKSQDSEKSSSKFWQKWNLH